MRDTPDLVNLLLDSGAKINAASQHGRTPLHMAALAGQTGNASLLQCFFGVQITGNADGNL